jgi:lipopolysaccharide transport system ATP-binding protein
MDKVAKAGRTVLFVSHDMQAMSRLATDVVYLSKGRIAFRGRGVDAINAYLTDTSSSSLRYERNGDAPEGPHVSSVSLKTTLEGNLQAHGDPMEIRVELSTPAPITGACLSIQIFDANQTNHLHVWVHDAEIPMCREGGIHTLICRIPKLRLYMGRYRLRVFFSEPPGGRSFETVEGICPFEVVMAHNHRLFAWYPNETAYLEDCSWEASRRGPA